MPITQNRMIALINSGLDYKQAYESTRAAIEQHFSAANAGEETWTQALEAVWSHTKPAIVVQNTNSAVVLAIEEQHFKMFRNRNKYAARKAREYRENLATLMADESNGTRTSPEPEQLKQSNKFKPTPPPPTKVSQAPNSTDALQVQSDSDLFGDAEPNEPDAGGKAAALDFVNSLAPNEATTADATKQD